MPPPVTVVIPARFESSRFPGKPLIPVAGKPLIQHVYEGAAAARVDRVLVATDDQRIHDAVKGFGGEVVRVEGPFRTGTDRVAAVARRLPGEIFVNLQGDEIVLHPDLLHDLIRPFISADVGMGTLRRRLTTAAEIADPAVVKVVTDRQGEALYFSRAPIPHQRDRHEQSDSLGLHWIHLGIYIFRRETLARFADLPTGVLEDTEKLEQLRALEHGIPIRVWETTRPSLRVDTVKDLERAADVLNGPQRYDESCAARPIS